MWFDRIGSCVAFLHKFVTPKLVGVVLTDTNKTSCKLSFSVVLLAHPTHSTQALSSPIDNCTQPEIYCYN